MRFILGTSGYSYKEWKGSFYPKDLPQAQMLTYYAGHFPAVEINNSFYHLPTPAIAKSWTASVPGSFQFILKAPQSITHFKRLKETARPDLKELLKTAAALTSHRGPLLFQLPGNFKKDLPRLESFLDLLGNSAQAAFEFRHESWFDDDTTTLLRARGHPLCIADTDDGPAIPLISTAPWGYLRLRRKNYTDRQLATWIKNLRTLRWSQAYIFFKHEETGTGPKFATRFLKLADRG